MHLFQSMLLIDTIFYFLNALSNMLLHLLVLRLVIGDDFNAVWDHVLDRTSTLRQRAEENAVVDLWRFINSKTRDFSYSARHRTFS